MGSATCTASKVKRLAAQEPLVNHQNFPLDKLSSNPVGFLAFGGFGGFFVLWVCLGFGVFLVIPPPPPFYFLMSNIRDHLFLQLCSFSTSMITYL